MLVSVLRHRMKKFCCIRCMICLLIIKSCMSEILFTCLKMLEILSEIDKMSSENFCPKIKCPKIKRPKILEINVLQPAYVAGSIFVVGKKWCLSCFASSACKGRLWPGGQFWNAAAAGHRYLKYPEKKKYYSEFDKFLGFIMSDRTPCVKQFAICETTRKALTIKVDLHLRWLTTEYFKIRKM